MGPREVAAFVGRVHARLTPRTIAAQCAQVPLKQGPLTVTSQRFVETAHKVGLAVHVWTIDEPMEMTSLLQMGVDGVMTDNTRALKDVFMARGLWY
jgi:glycerophosphoryl diester phosphodiesterase